jgi:hypothetical protein
MALVFNRDSIGVTAIGAVVTVPDHPKARLMYYLNCMCTVLSLDEAEHNRSAAKGNIYHKPGMSHYIPCLIAE